MEYRLSVDSHGHITPPTEEHFHVAFESLRTKESSMTAFTTTELTDLRKTNQNGLDHSAADESPHRSHLHLMEKGDVKTLEQEEMQWIRVPAGHPVSNSSGSQMASIRVSFFQDLDLLPTWTLTYIFTSSKAVIRPSYPYSLIRKMEAWAPSGQSLTLELLKTLSPRH
jgi:hypothetical protein